MGKRVLVIVLLVALALFAYVGYSSYDARRAGVTGQVFSSESVRDRQKAKAGSSGDSSAVSATTETSTPQDDTETIVYPPTAPTQTAPAAGTTTVAGGGAPLVTQNQQPAPAAVPAGDTISPNPTNGMVFAGTGRYQLYRQGNITWRLDTETGRSCILFATDDEWKKPRVYKAGCGRI